MIPFSSVAIIEKLALVRIAFCNAPVLSNAFWRRTSVLPCALPASSARVGPFSVSDMVDFREKRAAIRRIAALVGPAIGHCGLHSRKKTFISPEGREDHRGLSGGRLCAGTHKPVNDARICPVRGAGGSSKCRGGVTSYVCQAASWGQSVRRAF